MEEELDEIARGEREWVPLLRDVLRPAQDRVDEKRERAQRRDFTTETDEVCSQGHPMVIRLGRNGRFLACSLYPEHKESRPLPGEEAAPQARGRRRACPQCGEGRSSARRGRFGPFVGCSRYPDCDYIKKDGPPPPEPLPFEVTCPKNGDGHLVARRARRTGNVFWGAPRTPSATTRRTSSRSARSTTPTREPRRRAQGRVGDLPDLRRERPLPEDGDLVGARAAGGPAEPGGAARPARSGGAARRDRGGRGRGGRRRGPIRARSPRADATDRERAPTRERGGRDRPRRWRGSCAASRPATPRPTPAAPTRPRSGPTSTGWTPAGSTGDARRGRPPRLPRRPRRPRRAQLDGPAAGRDPLVPPPRARDGLAAGDPWGAIATPRLPRRLPRSSRSSRSRRSSPSSTRSSARPAGPPRDRGAGDGRLPSATGRSSRPPTPPASGSASWPPPTSGRSTCDAARSGCWARAARSGSGCWGGRRARRWRRTSRTAARSSSRRRGGPPRDAPTEVFLNHRGGPLGVRGLRYRPRPAPPPGRPPRRRLAAHAAPLVRDPPPRRRGGPAGRPGAARPREPGDDPGLHPRLADAPAARVPRRPPAAPRGTTRAADAARSAG